MMRDKHENIQPKAALVTLGCPMNQVDSEHILGGLVSLGFDIVPEDEADVVVVNTCGFIEEAREESIGTIMSVAGLKEKGKLRSLVVAGCLAERYGPELKRELTEADAVVGLKDRDSIPGLCLELLNRKRITKTRYTRVVSGPPHTAYLKIAEGCDNRCSYCAIPLIRGSFRSVRMQDVICEAEELASLGTRELILIAQDTTNYGADTDGLSLPVLLHKLSDIKGIRWIRLLYTHPAHFSDELIETVAGLPAVLPYIDMPIQHISRKILERMGRITSPDHIHALIDRLRERIEGLVIRTSLMVGFPGETDEDFQELLDFVRHTHFERLGAFIYSPEEGTRAAAFKDRPPKDLQEERYAALMELQADNSLNFHQALIGREMDMIVDAFDTDAGMITGRTYMDSPDIDGNFTALGGVEKGDAFCRVRITGADSYDLSGETVSRKEKMNI